MERITQEYIANKVGRTQSFINKLVKTKKRPNWDMAKKLAKTVPGTDPVLWLEGTESEIKAAIKNASQPEQGAA